MNKTFRNNITTNNGIENQNKILKHTFLAKSCDKSLTGIERTVMEEYLPNAYQVCVQDNVAHTSSVKKNTRIFLHFCTIGLTNSLSMLCFYMKLLRQSFVGVILKKSLLAFSLL
jgi:hypothetical protein